MICDAADGLLDTALRAQEMGHQVRMFVRKYDARTRPVGKGLVTLVDDWRSSMIWADLVLLEGNDVYLAEMEQWQRRGCAIIGGNDQSASWEKDREVGMQVLERAGIATVPWRRFTDYDAAIRHVERHGEPMFSKPCSGSADKSLSAKSGIAEDPAWQLRKWKQKHGRPPCPFVLQEALTGVEFGVGAWFGPGGFAEGWEENAEFKRFAAGDLGQATGEMGSMLRYVQRSKLADKVLKPLEEQLEQVGFVGCVDVNCMIDGSGTPYPLEFTMRFGFPSWNIETDLFECDPIEFLWCLSRGENLRGAHRMDEVAIGVTCVSPPFPHPPRDYDDVVGIPIYGDLGPGWHPCELQAPDEPDAAWASAGNYWGVAVGTGGTVRQARTGAYRTLKKISTPAPVFYRNDIGLRLKKDIETLQGHGFAAGLEF